MHTHQTETHTHTENIHLKTYGLMKTTSSISHALKRECHIVQKRNMQFHLEVAGFKDVERKVMYALGLGHPDASGFSCGKNIGFIPHHHFKQPCPKRLHSQIQWVYISSFSALTRPYVVAVSMCFQDPRGFAGDFSDPVNLHENLIAKVEPQAIGLFHVHSTQVSDGRETILNTTIF